ncbi:hypothetical protein L211DRAFT_844586 [Terfezia boudieri ATCC MYA-4762]|uniref:Uncharacterized protein n=1 Tax=Terfezia boudieri ATCC MYA-4762 TaxID=1051890 RepID=A0A3N4M3A4_9PEZI|nr:hypothetical protein L211DRAFT_844586 [Terfezia boudieri ATCC MYA-4762]
MGAENFMHGDNSEVCNTFVDGSWHAFDYEGAGRAGKHSTLWKEAIYGRDCILYTVSVDVVCRLRPTNPSNTPPTDKQIHFTTRAIFNTQRSALSFPTLAYTATAASPYVSRSHWPRTSNVRISSMPVVGPSYKYQYVQQYHTVEIKSANQKPQHILLLRLKSPQGSVKLANYSITLRRFRGPLFVVMHRF